MTVAVSEYRVISIGTLPSHPLWNEPPDVRSGHATTTFVECGSMRLVIDPGLPTTALAARFSERCPVRPEDVTHVFLTSFTFDHYRGLPLFQSAQWLIHEPERTTAERELEAERDRVDDGDLGRLIDTQLQILGRCQPADDEITGGVDLFPLPGPTAGTCGILLPQPRKTVLVCGDAVATVEHLAEGKVLPTCADIARAQESFREAIEIADALVLGRDNVALNPLRQS